MQARNPNNAQGVDVSHYQGVIDWAKVKQAGISFAFVKATEGESVADNMFARNAIGAGESGLAVGAYHFCRAGDTAAAKREANYFVSVVERSAGFAKLALPPVLDIETANGASAAAITAVCRTWLETVKQLTGRDGLLYTYASFADDYLDDTLAEYPLWLANYNVNQPADRAGWTRWTYLQYTDAGQVAGISGPVDRNEFEGTVDQLPTLSSLSQEDANKIILFLSAAYGCTDVKEAQAEFHRLANELRKASGQPVED